MPRDPRAFLWGVQQAAEAIAQFTAGLDAAGYQANPLVRSAAELRRRSSTGSHLNRPSRCDLEKSSERAIVTLSCILRDRFSAFMHPVRANDVLQVLSIPLRRGPEHARIFSAELRGTFVANLECSRFDVERAGDHQAARLE